MGEPAKVKTGFDCWFLLQLPVAVYFVNQFKKVQIFQVESLRWLKR